MNFRSILAACAIAVATVCSCEDDITDIFIGNGISRDVEDDFLARYTGVRVTDAFVWADGHTTEIRFRGKDRLMCKAIYIDGVWALTTKDLTEEHFIDLLPSRVYQTYRDLGYTNPRFDVIDNTNRVYAVTRNGIDHTTYDIRFMTELSDGSFASVQIMINEDGMLLLNSMEGYNKQELFHWRHDDALDIISQKYPGADVRTYANYSGNHHYIIMHEDRMKTVEFRRYSSDGEADWRETRYELDSDFPIPSDVLKDLDEFIKTDPRYSGFHYDTLLYRETFVNDAFGFQDRSRDDKMIIWISTEM